ncbi:hypothetical protein PG988_004965 [Apiospora saccharicola]
MCLVVVVIGIMIIGIVSTAQYLKETYAAASFVGNKEENNKTQDPAAAMALKEPLEYDVDPKSEDFVISQNPADRTMCPNELHGCQSFDIRPQAAHISTFVAFFVMIRRLFLG